MRDKLIIFDTTLRDEKFAYGTTMNVKEKLSIARQLANLGVDGVELNLPKDEDDIQALQLMIKELDGLIIALKVSLKKEDIALAGKLLESAENKRLTIVFDKTQGELLKSDNDTIKNACLEVISIAKQFVEDIEFVVEKDIIQDKALLKALISEAIALGVSTVTFLDLVGASLPFEYEIALNDYLSDFTDQMNVVFGIECKNDYGMSVANSLTGVSCGIRQLKGSINGIGRGAGSAPLEEMLLMIFSKQKQLNAWTSIRFEELYNTCRLVSRATGMPIPLNKVMTGRSVLSMEGNSVYPWTLEMIGIKTNDEGLNKDSGEALVKKHLIELGYALSDEELKRTYEGFLNLAEQKTTILDDDLVALVFDEAFREEDEYAFSHLYSFGGTSLTATATLGILHDGKIQEIVAHGKGPIDAAYRAADNYFEKILDGSVTLLDYRLIALTPGQDAQGEVRVKLAYKGHVVTGKGVSVDILEASIKAYVDGLNRLLGVLTK